MLFYFSALDIERSPTFCEDFTLESIVRGTSPSGQVALSELVNRKLEKNKSIIKMSSRKSGSKKGKYFIILRIFFGI